MNKIFFVSIVSVLIAGLLTAAAPTPEVTFTLVSGIPKTMNVGDTATVVILVESNQEFNYAQMLPDYYYPGRYVVGVQGGDHAAGGTIATLEITFMAKDSTVDLPNECAPVSVMAGTRFKGGSVASQRFDYCVAVH